jgi:hypothetical protein
VAGGRRYTNAVRVEITKRADGAGVLRCTRQDGSVTWQKQNERHAPYFALHDLTHFAVETTLCYRRGFFGLIAGGWDIEDTTGKGARGPLPPEAGEVEMLVGLIFTERSSGSVWTAEQFNAVSKAARRLGTEELAALRRRCGELYRKWSAVPVGEALELRYPG